MSEKQRSALSHAAERIRKYHEKQKQSSWRYEEADGSVYGQKVSPLSRVGVYVPGGKANYPSSMLMLAIPAKVAGVEEIVATVPTPNDDEGKLVFAAAALAGVNKVFTVGGAQAIAALAYGTETLPRVDKITGPGNIYVTVAKKQVYGEVGIDMIAGPSELTVICDGLTDPNWIAMDLFSQAEHDEQAQSILITTDSEFLKQVKSSIDKMLPRMERRKIIEASLRDRGLLILAEDLGAAAWASNLIAPEHLEVSVEDPEHVLGMIENAGAIFLGRYTAEALGDYCAGPSHVLPTSGTARFFSALGVYDFQKRSSIVNCSAQGAHSWPQPPVSWPVTSICRPMPCLQSIVSILSGIKVIRTTSGLFGFDDYCLPETRVVGSSNSWPSRKISIMSVSPGLALRISRMIF